MTTSKASGPNTNFRQEGAQHAGNTSSDVVAGSEVSQASAAEEDGGDGVGRGGDDGLSSWGLFGTGSLEAEQLQWVME